MSDAATTFRSRPTALRSIYQVHYLLPKPREEMARPCEFYRQEDVKECKYQVAGHMSNEDKQFIGLLQCNNGTVLKPIIKESKKCEIDFYNTVTTSEHPDLVELSKLIPKYYGCRKYTYNGVEMEYIIMEDLAKDMLEPCIMDIKIGRRTWDDSATPEKIAREQSKYAECKQEYAFCIPGLQFYRTEGAAPLRHGKDYGKRLRGKCVENAIKRFLSCGTNVIPRPVLLQFLSSLWRIQRWAATSKKTRLYATSLLLVYDAARAREGKCQTLSPQSCTKATRRQTTSAVDVAHAPPITAQKSGQWGEALDKLATCHSFEHNYEEKLTEIKCSYKSMLDRLACDAPPTSVWANVTLIDFAHACFNEENEECIDENFKEGVDNLVTMFEKFLYELDEQV